MSMEVMSHAVYAGDRTRGIYGTLFVKHPGIY